MIKEKRFKGIGVSEGYGIGKAVVIQELKLDYSGKSFTDAETESARLDAAVEKFTAETKALISELSANAGEKNAEILQGHLAMLADPFMIGQMKDAISGGVIAEEAVDNVCNMFHMIFSSAEDELTRQRATDVSDIKTGLLKILLGVEEIDIAKVEKGSILVACDFTPSMTSKINPKNVEGVIGEIGGVTSHSAIIARALGIPCILGVKDAASIIKSGDELVADAVKGEIIISPSADEKAEYSLLKEQEQNERLMLKEYINKPTVTKSGLKSSLRQYRQGRGCARCRCERRRGNRPFQNGISLYGQKSGSR